MKKRMASLVLGAVFFVGMLSGCSSSGTADKAKASDSVASSTSDSEEANNATGEQASTQENTASGEPLNVVLIVNGAFGDKSFADLVLSAVKRAETELGFTYTAVELANDPTKQLPTLEEFADDPDYDIILTGTYNMKEASQQVAQDYPDKKFILYDMEADFADLDLPNVYSMQVKQNEASFLAGAMATKFTSSGVGTTNADKKIGFVGGDDNFGVNDFLVGYLSGMEYADPDARCYISYIGSFTDTAKGKEMALAQYQQGADIVFQVAGGAGLGVLDAAKERDSYAIGVDMDQAEMLMSSDAELAQHIVTSVVKKMDIVLFDALKEAQEGTLAWGTHEFVGLDRDGVGLADNAIYQETVPQDIRDYVAGIEEDIRSGSVVVPTAIGMTVDEITEMRNQFKP